MDLIPRSHRWKLIDEKNIIFVDFPSKRLVTEKTVHSFYFKKDELVFKVYGM